MRAILLDDILRYVRNAVDHDVPNLLRLDETQKLLRRHLKAANSLRSSAMV
jgi:hypothetical protein